MHLPKNIFLFCSVFTIFTIYSNNYVYYFQEKKILIVVSAWFRQQLIFIYLDLDYNMTPYTIINNLDNVVIIINAILFLLKHIKKYILEFSPVFKLL